MKNSDLIFSSPLFKGLGKEDISALEKIISQNIRHYPENSTIFAAGECTKRFAMVLQGVIVIEHVDAFGTRNILSYVGQGGVFAETYAFLPNEAMAVYAVSETDSKIVFFNRIQLFSSPVLSADGRSVLFENLLSLSMEKNILSP